MSLLPVRSPEIRTRDTRKGQATLASANDSVNAEASALANADTEDLDLPHLAKSSVAIWIVAAFGLAAIGGMLWFSFFTKDTGVSAETTSPDAADIVAISDTEIADAAILILPDAVSILVDAGRVVPDAKKKGRKKVVRERPEEIPEPLTVKKDPNLDKKPTGDLPPLGFGAITIAADPYALVRVDGKEIGSTPII